MTALLDNYAAIIREYDISLFREWSLRNSRNTCLCGQRFGKSKTHSRNNQDAFPKHAVLVSLHTRVLIHPLCACVRAPLPPALL